MQQQKKRQIENICSGCLDEFNPKELEFITVQSWMKIKYQAHLCKNCKEIFGRLKKIN